MEMWTMKIRKIITGCAVVFVAVAADAQEGFVDFSSIPGVDDAPIVEVNITPFAISLVRGALSAADPQTAELLSRLRGIQVRSYDVSRNSRQFNNFIDNVTEDLEDEGWESVVTVQDQGSRVRVMMRLSEAGVSGMTVMVMDSSEAFFVNVDASVTTEDLGKIMAAFQLDQMLGAMLQEFTMPPPGSGNSE
jgi:hypothetical protein